MKLYLSSFRLGAHAQELGRMVTGRKCIGVVRNALDFSADAQRLEEGRAREFKELEDIGLAPSELDLRKFFGAREALEEVVADLDALWVVGGNTFIVRRAMFQSGLDKVLSNRSHDSSFVYAGYSAGVCVMAPTLRGLDLVDDPMIVPTGYAEDTVWDGLGFVPFAIAPHYRSPDPESGLVENVVDYFIANKIPFIALRDGDVFVKK